MKAKRIFPVMVPVTALLATFCFITGFNNIDLPIKHTISYYTDTFGEDEENPGDLPGDEVADESGNLGTFTCPGCGYVYDPGTGILDSDPGDGNNTYVAPGTSFEDLPADWTCPVCGAAKDGFSEDEDLKITDPQAWLTHLEHVLAMRSKHLLVLQRVIDFHFAKNPIHPSLTSIYHALESSSKSVLKAHETINEHKDYMAGLNPGENSTDEGTTGVSGTDSSEDITGQENDKEKGSGKENGINKDNPGQSQGNSKGKNKNK